MLRRFSSRRASLYDEFLKPRLAGAQRYDRIAGYFQSSLLELASESLADIARIRIVCNTEVSAEDVKTVRMASGARNWKKACCAWPGMPGIFRIWWRCMAHRRSNACMCCMTC